MSSHSIFGMDAVAVLAVQSVHCKSTEIHRTIQCQVCCASSSASLRPPGFPLCECNLAVCKKICCAFPFLLPVCVCWWQGEYPHWQPWLSIGYRGKGSQSFLVSLDGPHLLALDHDFHVHGVVPSVAFFVNTPEKAIDSFFDGQVFVTNKDKVTQTSSALRHATELTNLVRTHYSSSWFLLVTGAPTIVWLLVLLKWLICACFGL